MNPFPCTGSNRRAKRARLTFLVLVHSTGAPALPVERQRNDTAPAPVSLKGGREQSEALEALVVKTLDDDKAEEIVSIDLTGKSSVTDFVVIASGRSNRHVGALADHLLQALKESGHAHVKVEGLQAADWVLIDAGDVVVHLFRPEVRSFYDLEKMWGGAPETAA
ncbi:iojap-like protein [Glycocaulis alkaliphilus]|uniref:Ribosomal silencing factor RsfS n=1 Tax=Glycocaulis alkaliphilus TaxID=1434191 RepID=A0A3T0E6E2_9PROT|nr:ribosome silencing factor [Glycocaulis alkaliphilus]AZU02787.1 iojap-like protein [Glycocaulis alkaliphilus]